MPRKSTSSGARLWRWRTRSNKSASEAEGREPSGSYASPTAPFSTSYSIPNRFQLQQQQPYSPYLTESAHVLSLQNPSSTSNSEFQPNRPSISQDSNNYSESVLRLSRSETVLHSPTPTENELLSISTKGLYIKAKRGLESKLRLKTQKQVGSKPDDSLSKLIILPETDVSCNPRRPALIN